MEQEDILEELPFKTLMEMRDMMIPNENNKHYLKFREKCKEYLAEADEDFLKFIHKSCSRKEIKFLIKTAENVGILPTPIRLARYLKVDDKKIILGIEMSIIPAFKFKNKYYVKVPEMLPHISKMNLW